MHDGRLFHDECSRAWVSHHRLFTYFCFCWSSGTVIGTDQCWFVLFFCQRKYWLALISAFCLDLVLAGNSHGFCITIRPLVLFMIDGTSLFGAGQIGGIPSKTVGCIQWPFRQRLSPWTIILCCNSLDFAESHTCCGF